MCLQIAALSLFLELIGRLGLLIDHEFEKDVGRRLGHTIDRHYGRGYLAGRCTKGPKTVNGVVTAEFYKSSFGNDGWQVVNNVREALFANRVKIVNFSGNHNFIGKTQVFHHRLADGGGERYVRCTGSQHVPAYLRRALLHAPPALYLLLS